MDCTAEMITRDGPRRIFEDDSYSDMKIWHLDLCVTLVCNRQKRAGENIGNKGCHINQSVSQSIIEANLYSVSLLEVEAHKITCSAIDGRSISKPAQR